MSGRDSPEAKSLRVRPQVRGVDLDEQSRCAHYHGERDIIAIKLRCCGEFYACKECHDALADHLLTAWPQEMFDEAAVLCGECGAQLSINAYLACGNRCPECGSGFNPRCSLHHHFYFSIA